jgi:hypothetical protein
MAKNFIYRVIYFFKVYLPNSTLLVLLFLIASLFLASFLPIYPDEIATRILIERYDISDGYKVSLTPFCLEGFRILHNGIESFAGVFWSFISNIKLTYHYRALPIIIFLASILITFFSRYKKKEIHNIWFLFLILQGVGIYSFVVVRPEVFIAFFISCLLWIGFDVINLKRNFESRLRLFFYAFVVLFIFILACYVHPKSLYLLAPIFVIFFISLKKLKTINFCIFYLL